jgi:hypothetical protein
MQIRRTASCTANGRVWSPLPTVDGIRPMSRRHKQREEVFAIVRWDGFHSPGASPEVFVTVKEIVRSQDLAEAEVARLNALCEGSDIRYWWQPTRLFPEGRSAGPDVG